MSFSFWVGVGVTGGVVILVDEEEEAGGVEGRGEGGVAGWADEVTTGVPGGRGLPSRKATYCSLVILGGVTTGKSERRRKESEKREERRERREKKRREEKEEKKNLTSDLQFLSDLTPGLSWIPLESLQQGNHLGLSFLLCHSNGIILLIPWLSQIHLPSRGNPPLDHFKVSITSSTLEWGVSIIVRLIDLDPGILEQQLNTGWSFH